VAWILRRRILTLTDQGKVNWVSRLYLSVSNVLTTQSLFAAITRVAPLHQRIQSFSSHPPFY
jgi:hypothetical protein